MFVIDDKDVELLETFFDEDVTSDDVLDFSGIHGLLTAAAVQTENIDIDALWNRIFDEYDAVKQQNINEKTVRNIKKALKHLYKHISTELYSQDQVELPYEIIAGQSNDDCESWCCGFMEWVFAFEDHWFAEEQEEVSSMLLPIEVGSMLFADEEELKDIYNNEKLTNSMLGQISEVLTDLYLHFQSPE